MANSNQKSSKPKPTSAQSGGKGRQFRGGSGKPPYGNKLQGTQNSVIGTPYRGQSNKDNSTKQDRRAEEAADTDVKMSRGNPVSYYTKFSTFASDAANLPFAKPLGAASKLFDTIGKSDKLKDNFYFTPGVMRIQFTPSIGISDDYSSPINRASIRFYTYLRSNQKASASYDHQDVTMMEVALDSCYMFHALCSKAYSTVNLFTPANEYYSRAIVRGCGFDFDDLRANLQDFRAYINAFAYSLGQYALPDNMELFNRHRWMCEGLYVDGPTKKAQTYMFVPHSFFQYDNTVATGSQCTEKVWLTTPTTVHTFAQAKTFGDELLAAISNEQDFAVISGDIYNFYGGKTYQLPYITENYAVLPTFDQTVLSQIENITLVGDLTNVKVTQNPSVNQGAILFHPGVSTVTNGYHITQSQINMHVDRPTSDQVLEATRLMVGLSGTTSADMKFVTCGTEIVNRLDIFGRAYDDSGNLVETTDSYQHSVTLVDAKGGGVDNQDGTDVIKRMGQFAQFDWAPNIRVYRHGTTLGQESYCGQTWDIDNVEDLPLAYLQNINLACLLSLFSVDVNRE